MSKVKKKRGYFVSYRYSYYGSTTSYGFGRCFISFKIKSFDDIEKAEKLILENNPNLVATQILIQNYSTKSVFV